MVDYSEKYVSGESEIEFLPTEHKPGSEEKIEVLIQRYDEGLPFWHSNDEPVLSHYNGKQGKSV